MIAWWTALALAMPVGPAELGPGSAWTSTQHTELALALDVRLAGAQLERRIDRHHRQAYTANWSSDGLSIAWTENRHVATEPGHAHDRELPVVGHTYLLRDDGVARADGTVPSEEERAISEQIQVAAMLRAFRDMLGDDPAPGDVRPAGSMFAGILDEAPGDPRVAEGSLVIGEVQTDGGVDLLRVILDLKLVSEGPGPRGADVRTEVDAQGFALVEVATGWTRHFEVAGPVRVTATRADLSTTGVGQFSSVTRLAFTP